MAFASFRCEVDAPYELVWQELVNGYMNPEAYVADIANVAVESRQGGEYARTFDFPVGSILEQTQICKEDGRFESRILSPKHVEGHMQTRIRRLEDGKSELHCKIEWSSSKRNWQAALDEKLEAFVRDSLNHVKDAAEGR